MARAKSLEDVIAAHEVFLEGASRTAFTAPQQTSKLLRTAAARLLSLIGEFAVSGLSCKVSICQLLNFHLHMPSFKAHLCLVGETEHS